MQNYMVEEQEPTNGGLGTTLPEELTVAAATSTLNTLYDMKFTDHDLYQAAKSGILPGRREFGRYGRWFFKKEHVLAFGERTAEQWASAFKYEPQEGVTLEPELSEMLTVKQIIEEFPINDKAVYDAFHEKAIPGGRMIKHAWYAPRGGVQMWMATDIQTTGYPKSHYPVAVSDVAQQDDIVYCHYCQQPMLASGKGRTFRVHSFRINKGTAEEPRWEVAYLPVHPSCMPETRAARQQRDQALLEVQTAYHLLEEVRNQVLGLTRQHETMQETIERMREQAEQYALEKREADKALAAMRLDAHGWENSAKAYERALQEEKERLAQALGTITELQVKMRENSAGDYIELRADYELLRNQRDQMKWELEQAQEQLRQHRTQNEVLAVELEEARRNLTETTVLFHDAQVAWERARKQVATMKTAMAAFVAASQEESDAESQGPVGPD